jgi:putative aldouronate transport system permease protein
MMTGLNKTKNKRLESQVHFKKVKRDSTMGTIIVYALLIIISLTMILPFIHELAKSFSYPTEVETGRVSLIPLKPTLGNYYYFWRKQLERLGTAFLNTISLTVITMIWTVINTAILAFPMSRPGKEFRFGNAILLLVIFCFVFNRPVIPYFLTVKGFGLMNTHLALILTHTITPYYLILMLTFFRGLPEELVDACRMDGGNELTIFRHVVLPLSKPVLASVAIFAGVNMWNIFFHALLFLRDANLQPLQVIVREVMRGQGDFLEAGIIDNDPFKQTESIKSALIILSILPVAIAYPFLQKYFVKGAMLGSLKS